ncbi:MAG: NADH-quinone oxidoreductase subunit A, partial [Acidimicrobiia bacterium]
MPPLFLLTLQSLTGIEKFAGDWIAVALSAVVAVVAIGGMFGASRLLSARRHSEVKLTPYECGIPPTS